MADGAGGIYRFGSVMSSGVLAACRPKRSTLADSRALTILRGLGLSAMAAATCALAAEQFCH